MNGDDDASRIAVVTGAAAGIGRGFSRRLAARGWRVVVADIDMTAATLLASEIGGVAVRCDVSNPPDLVELFDYASTLDGEVSLVALNAGMVSGAETFAESRYRRSLAVNVDHVVLGSQAALPALRRSGGGRILVTASLAGLMPMSTDPVYTLTKHAVIGFVRSAATALAHESIVLTAVCPGFVETALIEQKYLSAHEFPLLTPEAVAAGMLECVDRGLPGECWYIQPGRSAAPFDFRRVPGPR